MRAATHCCLFEISANIFKRVLIACSEFTSKSTPVLEHQTVKNVSGQYHQQRQFVALTLQTEAMMSRCVPLCIDYFKTLNNITIFKGFECFFD